MSTHKKLNAATRRLSVEPTCCAVRAGHDAEGHSTNADNAREGFLPYFGTPGGSRGMRLCRILTHERFFPSVRRKELETNGFDGALSVADANRLCYLMRT